MNSILVTDIRKEMFGSGLCSSGTLCGIGWQLIIVSGSDRTIDKSKF
jgi:hypothetical protein